ncbi:DsbA family protein [Angustibacter aerolatus]
MSTPTTAVDLDRHVYGSPDATCTLVEYGDFECPYCGAAAPVLRELVDTSEGRVRLVFRHFPLFQKHPFALAAALAAEAAGDRFWAMHDVLFAHQEKLGATGFRAIAVKAGVEHPDDVVGAAAQRFQPMVQADYRSGADLGVRGTPTLFVDGRVYTGRLELAALRSGLDLGRR